MKNITKTGLSLVVLTTLLIGPIATNAQINANLSGTVETKINSNTSASTSNNADGSARLDAGVDVNVETQSNTEENETNTSTTKTLKLNTSGVAIISSSQVSSESDLKIFSSNVSAKKNDVAKIDIDSQSNGESEVKVVYRHKGSFLGFIPVTIKSTTVVEAKADSETEVHSNLSWWSFLVANTNYNRENLETRIKNNPTVSANAKINASAQSKARIAEALVTEISINATVSASSDN